MTNNAGNSIPIEQVFPSTNWRWELRKIRVAPAGDRQRGAAAPLQRRKRRRDLSRRMQVVITYRGGASCSYLLQFEGKSWRYDGFLALHDVVSDFARRCS